MIDIEQFFDTSEKESRPVFELITSFAAFLIPFFIIVIVQRRIPFPDELTNMPVILPVAAGTLSLKLVLEKFFDKNIFQEYGVEREYIADSMAGIFLGILFQALITFIMIQTGSAELVKIFSYSTGLSIHLWFLALISTVIGFLAVAFWEELLFRGVLIKKTSEALNLRFENRQISILTALFLGPAIFGIPHVLAIAEGASPSFAAFQASIAALYFGVAYVLTDSIAMPTGIHFISNFWFTSVFGAPENGFPAIARIERNLELGSGAILEFIVPMVILIGLIIGYCKYSGRLDSKNFV